MNIYRDRGVTCTSSDLLDGGGGGGVPTQHAQYHHAANGHIAAAGPPEQVGAPPRMSMPKMGVKVKTRIAEWPPRRSQSRESLLENGQMGNGGSHHGDDGSISALSSDFGLVRGGMARLPRRRSKDVEFRGGGFGPERNSPISLRVLPPLRQRSNSELTLSEQDENEVGPALSAIISNLDDNSFF